MTATMDTGEHRAIVVPLSTPWAEHPSQPAPVRLDNGQGPSHGAPYLLGSAPDSGWIDWDATERPGTTWVPLDTRTGRLIVDDDRPGMV